MTFKEVGRLSLTMFNKLYTHYKNDFDFETTLRRANLTYKEAFKRSQESEEWI